MSVTTYRENLGPVTIPVHQCRRCGGRGSQPTHRVTCPCTTGAACFRCGRNFTALSRAVAVTFGEPARECLDRPACTERRAA